MNVIDQFRGPVPQKFGKHPLLAWREEIPTLRVEELRRAHLPGSRKRLWTVEFMLWFWLTAGIHRERSFNAVGTELWMAILAEVPQLAGRKLNSGRMADGRARIPVEMLRKVREEFAAKGVNEGQGMGLWRGRRVMWLDGSTLSMPDEPELRKAFGGPRNQRGASPFPVMRIVNLGVAATRLVVGSAYGAYGTSEIELSDPLLGKIQAGDVLTADRYFASAQNLARVKRQGADAVMRKHAWLKVSLHKRRRIGPEDWILELSVPVDARKAHPELPETIEIRVFHIVVGHGAQRVDLWIETTRESLIETIGGVDCVLLNDAELSAAARDQRRVDRGDGHTRGRLHLLGASAARGSDRQRSRRREDNSCPRAERRATGGGIVTVGESAHWTEPGYDGVESSTCWNCCAAWFSSAPGSALALVRTACMGPSNAAYIFCVCLRGSGRRADFELMYVAYFSRGTVEYLASSAESFAWKSPLNIWAVGAPTACPLAAFCALLLSTTLKSKLE